MKEKITGPNGNKNKRQNKNKNKNDGKKTVISQQQQQ